MFGLLFGPLLNLSLLLVCLISKNIRLTSLRIILQVKKVITNSDGGLYAPFYFMQRLERLFNRFYDISHQQKYCKFFNIIINLVCFFLDLTLYSTSKISYLYNKYSQPYGMFDEQESGQPKI